ncbi:alpha/beta fold hydrolase [Microbacterium hominis]|nr:alpha/beta hydrolase [Microbacterium hominis]
MAAAGAAVRGAGTVSPEWGGALALKMFARIERPRPLSATDEPTMLQARRSTVRVPGLDRRGTDLAVYDWGYGNDVVALAHGWDGRASQFTTLVRELVADGRRVVAFDAPAHGASPGRAAYVRDWVDALAALQARHGRFRAVVGHSFGGLAALIAVGQGGIGADRVVTVSAPADPAVLFARLRGALGYDERVDAALRARFARRYFPGEPDPIERLSPLRVPLPEDTRLLAVHDERDPLMPVAEVARIAGAHAGARVVLTSGLGHNRILAADEFLDAVMDFVAHPADVVEPVAPGATQGVWA